MVVYNKLEFLPGKIFSQNHNFVDTYFEMCQVHVPIKAFCNILKHNK